MSGIILTLEYYLQYPFVRYALIVGVLISLCSALLGVTLVLKRFSFIGDGLSHIAFGAMAIASVLNFTNNTPFVMAMTVVCAIFLLKAGQNVKDIPMRQVITSFAGLRAHEDGDDFIIGETEKDFTERRSRVRGVSFQEIERGVAAFNRWRGGAQTCGLLGWEGFRLSPNDCLRQWGAKLRFA